MYKRQGPDAAAADCRGSGMAVDAVEKAADVAVAAVDVVEPELVVVAAAGEPGEILH